MPPVAQNLNYVTSKTILDLRIKEGHPQHSRISSQDSKLPQDSAPEVFCQPISQTEVTSTPTSPVDNVVIATKGLQDRNINIIAGTTV